MKVRIQELLSAFVPAVGDCSEIQLPNAVLDPEKINAIMINEVVPSEPDHDFYGGHSAPEYVKTTLQLFQKAGAQVNTIEDITAKGIYITNAVKIPKKIYKIEKEVIEQCVPILARELALFPHLKVVMLMGDVAKRAFNMIARQKGGKNVVPAISTYKIRNDELHYDGMRVLPSYIMTGGNILIEKSKFEMAAEDIGKMMTIIGRADLG